MKALYVSCLALIATYSAAGQKSLLNPINDLGIGTFSLEAQHVFMARDYQSDTVYTGRNYSEYANSMALTAGYASPEKYALQVGASYIFSEPFLFGGRYPGNEADHLGLGKIRVFNEAYIRYSFRRKVRPQKQKKEVATLTIGRQLIASEFTPDYSIRQNDQAFEAAVLNVSFTDQIQLIAGHIHSFNGWSNTSAFTRIYRLEPYASKTAGMQFAEITLFQDSTRQTRLSFYDFFGYNLYNTAGMYLDKAFSPAGSWIPSFRLRYINQNSVGRYNWQPGGYINANGFQAAIRVDRSLRGADDSESGLFRVESGLMLMIGEAANNTLRTPFQGTLIVHEPLYEIDKGREGGSNMAYLQATINQNRSSFMALFVQTNSGTADLSISEFNLIYGYTFIPDRFTTSLKVAVARYDQGALGLNRVLDFRVFTTFNF